MIGYRSALTLCLCFAVVCPMAFAQEQKERQGATGRFDDAESEMKDLLEQLESPRFSERRAATARLQQLGALAHGVLERIAVSGDAESSSRALELLKQAARSSDPGVKSSAREVLKRIAESDGPQARGADRALMNPDRPQKLPPVPQPMLPGFPFQFAPGPIQPPPFAPGGQNNLRISIRSVNGVRTIEVVQNNKTFRFRDVPGGIETERPDGKGGAKKRTFKDAREMEKSDAEIFEIYQKAGGDRAGKAVGGMMRMLPPGGIAPGIPVFPRQRLNPPNPPRRALPEPPGSNPGPRLELIPDVQPIPLPKSKPVTKPNRIEV